MILDPQNWEQVPFTSKLWTILKPDLAAIKHSHAISVSVASNILILSISRAQVNNEHGSICIADIDDQYSQISARA